MKQIKVLTIIPVVNLWREYTEPCIQSLNKQKLQDAKFNIKNDILIIDNNSEDETQKQCLFLETNKKIKYLKNKENWGVGKSWNYGIKYALEEGYDYVFIINNDILFHTECLFKLLERFEKKDDNIVLITALDIRCECNNPQDIFNKNLEDKKNIYESESPNFSTFMVNKKFIENVGFSDEGFYPAYFEDNDLHYRVKLTGLKAISLPQALFYHFASRTQKDIRYSEGLVNHKQFVACSDYYIAKWGGSPGYEKFKNPFNDVSKSIKWTKQEK